MGSVPPLTRHANGTRFQSRDYDRVRDVATGGSLSVFCGLGCMADYAVVRRNAIIPLEADCDDVPFQKACLFGCGVTTGLGAVLNRAQVRPGATCC